MIDVVFVTGNADKAYQFSRHVGRDIEHHAAETDEIQTLDPKQLTAHKATQAFRQLGRPVLVEDVTLDFAALGGLPGPFVKFFVDADGGVTTMCRMLDGFNDRSAIAGCTYAYFDGNDTRYFTGQLAGVIAPDPKGTGGYGFDRIFIPDGFDGRTAAELDAASYDRYYSTIKPFDALKEFLAGIDG